MTNEYETSIVMSTNASVLPKNPTQTAKLRHRIEELEQVTQDKLLQAGVKRFHTPELTGFLLDLQENLESIKSSQKKRMLPRDKVVKKEKEEGSLMVTQTTAYFPLYPSSQLGPIRIGRYRLSLVLKLSGDVYCNRLDPSGFWVGRKDVECAFRSSTPSLIRHVLLDACLTLSNLTPSEKYFIQPKGQLTTLIPMCFANPSLNDLVALLMLSTSEFFKKNPNRAKRYLGSAFRMADMLGMNPDHKPQPIVRGMEPIEDFNKMRIWEIMIYFHGVLFAMHRGPPLTRCRTESRCFNLMEPIVFLPLMCTTLERLNHPTKFSVNQLKVHDPKQLPISYDSPFDSFLVNIKRSTLPKSRLLIYNDSIRFFMKVYQHGLNLQSNYFSNQAKFDPQDIHLPPEQKQQFLIEAIPLLANMPPCFKIPQIWLGKSAWREITTDYCDGERLTHLGNYAYTTVLSSVIYINYPFNWFAPQPLKLDQASWGLTLEATHRLFRFFMGLFSSLHELADASEALILYFGECATIVYSYLNAIVNCPDLTPHLKKLYFNRAQAVIDELDFLARANRHGTCRDAQILLGEFQSNIDKFNLPDDCLTLRISEDF